MLHNLILFYNQTSQHCYTAVDPVLTEPLTRAAKTHGGSLEQDGDEWLIVVSTLNTDIKREKITSFETALPKGFTLGSLRPEHAEVVVSNWNYQDARPNRIEGSTLTEVSCCKAVNY